MSNQETINFTVDFTLSDPDGREGTIPEPEELAQVICDVLQNTYWQGCEGVLGISVKLGDQEN